MDKITIKADDLPERINSDELTAAIDEAYPGATVDIIPESYEVSPGVPDRAIPQQVVVTLPDGVHDRNDGDVQEIVASHAPEYTDAEMVLVQHARALFDTLAADPRMQAIIANCGIKDVPVVGRLVVVDKLI